MEIKALHRSFGLEPKDMAEVIVDIVVGICERKSEVDVVRTFEKKYKGEKLKYAILLAGKYFGMLAAINFPYQAQSNYERMISVISEIAYTPIEKRDERCKELIKRITQEIEEDERYIQQEEFESKKDVV